MDRSPVNLNDSIASHSHKQIYAPVSQLNLVMLQCSLSEMYLSSQLIWFLYLSHWQAPGPIALSVESPAADPGVASLIPARSNPFMEVDHEIISTLISSSCWNNKGCCQLKTKVCARSTGQPHSPGKGVVKWTDLLNMTIAVDWEVKPQTKLTKHWKASNAQTRHSSAVSSEPLQPAYTK